MTTKSTTPVAAPEALEPSPLSYVIALGQKAYELELIGPANLVMNEAACHIRSGYVPCPARPPYIFPYGGNLQLFLILGSPDPTAIAAAQETNERAIREQEKRYNEDVDREVGIRVEALQRAEIARQVAEAEAEQARVIARIKAEADARIAAIQSQK